MLVEPANESEGLVLKFFATLGAGDLEGVRELLHEEATWTPQVRAVPGAGVHRGKRGIVDEFLAPVRGLFRQGDPKVIIDSLASKGGLVFAESHSDGCLADGRPYENLYAWAVEVRDRKIYAVREYFDSHYVMGLFAR
ncbi:MAG TPA: nuclear transport factor 2 family protein [Steroidobacteraceae bacterium]|nr:nuclear transport factor 2 family protein [Steroidobacteraceae bacterium]